MNPSRGHWHGPKRYFGLHYDLHANQNDTELGVHADAATLVPLLKLMAPDFVQTDCKGHPGHTSWFSRTPDATVSPGVKRDAMKGWRAATRALGLPLHCHYSGIWDAAACKKHPEWAVVRKDAKAPGKPSEKVCPRSPYLEQLLIPQMLELIDEWGVDGFWVDGDLWAVEPCYCEQCLAAWRAETAGSEPPTKEDDSRWPAWMYFHQRAFEAYVTRYCDAVHAHKAGVLVCSNWLQTFKHPGEPAVPTDWISGDNSPSWGLDGSRCEARFLSTRGKPWDIMLWAFYCAKGFGQAESPWSYKPPEMLMQEAAVLLSFGGNVQIYENPGAVRDGRLIPWRMKRLGAVGRFVKARRAVCQGSTTLPQIAVLHSETHVRAHLGMNLHWSADCAPVQGAVFSLLECHYGVDILDEWALRPRLADFPVIVVPERHDLAADLVPALQDYVRAGGRLLVTGAESFDRFGADFLGARSVAVEEKKSYFVPALDGAEPVYSAAWRLLEPTTAKTIGALGKSALRDDRLLPHPAAILIRVGRGRVAYIPASVCRYFNDNRYPMTRAFLHDVMERLAGDRLFHCTAPASVDVAMRQRDGQQLFHFVNRASGLPQAPHAPAIDEVPAVGPLWLHLELPAKPHGVRLVLEDGQIATSWQPRRKGGRLTVEVAQVRLHAALEVTP